MLRQHKTLTLLSIPSLQEAVCQQKKRDARQRQRDVIPGIGAGPEVKGSDYAYQQTQDPKPPGSSFHD
jgi:hypothetical protein